MRIYRKSDCRGSGGIWHRRIEEDYAQAVIGCSGEISGFGNGCTRAVGKGRIEESTRRHRDALADLALDGTRTEEDIATDFERKNEQAKLDHTRKTRGH